MRKLVLLRPEPGLAASTERARVLGLEVIAVPLFRVEPIAWSTPDPSAYDALLLTSANAVRHGDAGLDRLKGVPVHAVGAATAEAAHNAGFIVASVGEGGVEALLHDLPTGLRLLHLAGQDHFDVSSGHHIDRRIVYRSAVIERPQLPSLDGVVVAVHSPRAGIRLAELAEPRGRTVIAAISAAAANACGHGWQSIAVAATPDDASLLVLAARLCQISSPK